LSEKKSSGILNINDLRFVWKIFSKNWYILLISGILSWGAGYLFSYKITDIYGAKTQILLKATNQVNTSSIISDNASPFFGGTGQSFIDNSNEIRVIQSYDLIKRALDRLDDYVSYFLVGRIRTNELYEGVPFKVKVFEVNPQLFEQHIRFKILDEKHFSLTYLKKGKDEITSGLFGKELIEPGFHLLVLPTAALNPSSIEGLSKLDYLVQIHDRESMVYKFQAAMSVRNPDYTNVLEITLEDPLAQRAAAFLDTLSTVYIENTLRSKYELNENTLKYIDKQMGEVTNVLDDIQDTMQNYKERNSILDLDKEGTDYFNKLIAFDADKAKLSMEISSLNDLEHYIISGKDAELLPPSVYVKEDVFLQQAVAELYRLQLTRNSSLSSSKEGSPGILTVDGNIEALKKNLLTYIGNLRLALKQRVEDLEHEIGSYVSSIKLLPVKQRGLFNIQRKLAVNEGMYTFFTSEEGKRCNFKGHYHC